LHNPKKCIYCFATGYAIFIVVAAAINACDKVLNAGLAFWQWLLAEKAEPSLSKQ